jgi:hypothetical protein
MMAVSRAQVGKQAASKASRSSEWPVNESQMEKASCHCLPFCLATYCMLLPLPSSLFALTFFSFSFGGSGVLSSLRVHLLLPNFSAVLCPLGA